MPEYTPQDLRKAAEIVKEFTTTGDWANARRWVIAQLSNAAETLEKEEAAKDRQYKRFKELAMELHNAAYHCNSVVAPSKTMNILAKYLLEHYPILIDETDSATCEVPGHPDAPHIHAGNFVFEEPKEEE